MDCISHDVAHQKEREKRAENLEGAMPKEVHEVTPLISTRHAPVKFTALSVGTPRER